MAGLVEEGLATAQAGESSWSAWLSALPCPSWVLLFFDLSVPLLPQIGFRCAQSAPLLWLGGHRGPCLRPPPKVPTPPLGARGLQLGPSEGGPPGGHWEPSPGGPGDAVGVGPHERRCADMGVCVDPRCGHAPGAETARGAGRAGRKGPQCLAEMWPPHVSLKPGEARLDPAVLGPRGPQVPRAPVGRRFCECCTCGPASPSPQSSLGPQAGCTKPLGRLPTPGLLPALLRRLFLRSFSQKPSPTGCE